MTRGSQKGVADQWNISHGGTDECIDIPMQEIREIRGNDFQQKLIISFADDFFATDDTDECISLR